MTHLLAKATNLLVWRGSFYLELFEILLLYALCSLRKEAYIVYLEESETQAAIVLLYESE
jgi:hypothetical protein